MCREVVCSVDKFVYMYLSNIFSHVCFRRQKVSFQAQTERKTGFGKMWSRFVAQVSGACVTGLTPFRLSDQARDSLWFKLTRTLLKAPLT